MALAQVTEQHRVRGEAFLLPLMTPAGVLPTGGWGVFWKCDILNMGGGSRCGLCWGGADMCLQAVLWTKDVDEWVPGQERKERVGVPW